MALTIRTVFDAPGPQPNGMQATPEGLWILDQQTNQVSLMTYDGTLVKTLETGSDRGSGVALRDGVLWLASTYSREILQVDAQSGATLASYPTPGAVKTGAHGLEWRGEELWMAVPPAATIYAVDVAAGFQVVHQIPAPGNRPHGLAWEDGDLWCVETNHRALYRLNPADGTILQTLTIPPECPEPHGMTLWDGVFWYCDAHSRAVCQVIR